MAFMITIVLIGGVACFGILLTLCELRNAPEGFEDEAGFHIDWRNNRPDVANVSCIWLSAAETASPAH